MLPIAVTIGCPSGIGPEIILKYFCCSHNMQQQPPTVVSGDIAVLQHYAEILNISASIIPWQPGNPAGYERGLIPVYETSTLPRKHIVPGKYNSETANAMATAITSAVHGIEQGIFSAICTCPISKEALQCSGYPFPGHTEMLAKLTGSHKQVMMLAGSSLRVTLATIHCSIAQVPEKLSQSTLLELYHVTSESLIRDFNIPSPKIAVAALNPHAGEAGMFGNEEQTLISPSITRGVHEGINLHGPFPPDTIFNKAVKGDYDAVICMYHDQGLIPFKLLHFKDGVNVTLGLPIVRTSVDHGTAYDIAGKGLATPESLIAAIQLAQTIITNRKRHIS